MVMKVIVDRDLCQGHSVCLGECPEVFELEEGAGYPQVKLLLKNPPEELREQVMMAAHYCPNGVIKVEEE